MVSYKSCKSDDLYVRILMENTLHDKNDNVVKNIA